MSGERRFFCRKKIQGIALIYDDFVQPTRLLDLGLGGMRVSGKQSFSRTGPYWVEFTLVGSNEEMIFGKRVQTVLAYSKFDADNRRFVTGFTFLTLTNFQHVLISDVVGA